MSESPESPPAVAPETLNRLRGVRAFFFDADNTLWDLLSAGTIAQAELRDAALARANAALAAQGRPEVTRAAFNAELFATMAQKHVVYAHRAFDDLPTLQAAFPGQRPSEVLADETARFHERERELSRAYQGTRAVLEGLATRGYGVFVFSGATADALGARWRTHGFTGAPIQGAYSRAASGTPEELTDAPVLQVSDAGIAEVPHKGVVNMGNPKRDNRGWALVFKDAGVRPHEAVVTGDNPAEDVRNAQELGALGFLAGYGQVPRPHLEDGAQFHPYMRELKAWVDGAVAAPPPDHVLLKPDELLRIVEAYDLRPAAPFTLPAANPSSEPVARVPDRSQQSRRAPARVGAAP